ncbi:MAG: N-6 DNA methylase [Armatimonadota bacterium]
MLQPQLFGPFRNEGLFTDHYLQDVLPKTPGLWDLSDLEAVRQALLALWQDQAGQVAHYSEAQLEDHFVKPVLKVLGHVYEPQALAGQHKPDYAFFPDEATRVSVLPADGRREYWSHALAVGDAKSWERKLDKATGDGNGWDFLNPSFQVGQYYLAETGCRWAILTNGRCWRLYAGDPKPDMQRFYEVDLPALLGGSDPQALAYFVLFFRRQAFLPDPAGQPFLDRVRAESDLAANKLRENVQEGVYRALLAACRGFANHSPNNLPEGGLEAIYDNALVFLYRLLFVLYAEAAELLPLRENVQYRNRYSLHAITQEVAGSPGSFLEGVVTLWPKLKALFGVIDRGHAGLGVPAYNGGLFDPQKHPFLEKYELADRHVAQVVDLLARTQDDKGDLRPVDYRDLGVRHLGSIYEGLLEYKLALATEPMVVIRDAGKEKWVPAAGVTKAGGERCETGELYLVTDKGERKASGSYYTPQFIVDYIVENTLGPLVDRCATPQDILNLKVLDPAMGSGHFLVKVTDFLAGKLVERGHHDEADPSEESDLSRLKRLVVEHCIYGVDLNPLAVELAKLSLWLDTVAKGQPLSFLDHHLRCGNSLIGARVGALSASPQAETKSKRAAKEEAKGQLALFDDGAFTQHANRLVFGFGEIAEGPSNSREAVQHKGEILARLDADHRRPYREMADLWCSASFGNEYGRATYDELIQHLQGIEVELSEAAAKALARSRELAGQYRFFHWELEFPEVFFDEYGLSKPEGGFEAVVGNPPYGAVLDSPSSTFARGRFESAGGALDVFALFLEMASSVVRPAGLVGMIVPGGWLTSEQHGPIRRVMLRDCPPQRIVVLPYDVFPDAYVDTIIYAGTVKPDSATPCLVRRYGIRDVITRVDQSGEPFIIAEWATSEGQRITTQVSGLKADVLRRLGALSVPLASVSSITRGITPFSPAKIDGAPLGYYGSVNRYSATLSDRHPTEYGAHLSEYRDIGVFRGPRIIVRRIISRSFRLQCTGMEDELLVNKSSLIVHATGGLAVWYLLSLANAKVHSARFVWISEIARRDDYPQVDIATLGRFPIRQIDLSHPTLPEEKERLQGECLTALDAGNQATPLRLCEQALATHAALYGPAGKPELQADPYWQAAIATADRDFPGREDLVHDLLAALAERMMDLNRRKHEETGKFLQWLEWYIGCPVEELPGKTILQDFYKHADPKALLDVLAKSKKRLGKPITAAFVAEVTREHRQALAAISPILADLEQTNELIDEIVFRLYGLSEEEIVVVKGRT